MKTGVSLEEERNFLQETYKTLNYTVPVPVCLEMLRFKSYIASPKF